MMDQPFFNAFSNTENVTNNSETVTSASDKEFEIHRLKCEGEPPSAEEIMKAMKGGHLFMHLILILMSFTTLAIFIEEVFYLRAKIQKNYRRRRMSIIQAGIPPLFTITAVVGMFFPRGNLMIDFVCSVYFGFAMHALLNLMVNYFGGISLMLERLSIKETKVKISTPPLCCCCRCLPLIPMNRKFFKILYYLTFQAALSRPIVLFFRGVFVLDPTFSINEVIFTAILTVSILTGMWSLIIFRGVSSVVLKQFRVTAKFFCFQIVMVITNIQPFILKLCSLPCVLPYTTRGRIITVNYQIMVAEFFVISLLMRCLYRTKGDAENLISHEHRNGSKKVNYDGETVTIVECVNENNSEDMTALIVDTDGAFDNNI